MTRIVELAPFGSGLRWRNNINLENEVPTEVEFGVERMLLDNI